MRIEIKLENAQLFVTRPTMLEIRNAGHQIDLTECQSLEDEGETIDDYCREFYKVDFDGTAKVLHFTEFHDFWDELCSDSRSAICDLFELDGLTKAQRNHWS